MDLNISKKCFRLRCSHGVAKGPSSIARSRCAAGEHKLLLLSKTYGEVATIKHFLQQMLF